jgi:hypothetical protein
MSTGEKVWDGRGDRLCDARLSNNSGRAADDMRLSSVHMRLLLHLGRQNSRRGWVRISQSELAEKWSVSRSRLNVAVNQLVEWKYLRKQTQAQSGESFCLYKIILDEEDDEGSVPPREHPSRAGSVPSAEHPPEGGSVPSRAGSVPSREQGCSAQGTGVFPIIEHTNRHAEEADDNPPLPHGADRATGGKSDAGAGKRDAARNHVIERLRADAVDLDVVEYLLVPILSQRRFSAPDPLGTLRELRTAARGLSRGALDRAAQIVLDAQVRTVKVERLRSAIETVRKGGECRLIERGTPQWSRWVEFYRTSGSPVAAVMSKTDKWLVPSEWPPPASGAGYAAAKGRIA